MRRLLILAAVLAALCPGISVAASASPAMARSACVTHDVNGPNQNCGPYHDPRVAWSNGFNTYVGINGWGCGSGGTGCGPTTLTAPDPKPSDPTAATPWSLTTTEPAGNTAVLMYPDEYQLTTDVNGHGVALSTLHYLRSTFSETMPAASKGTIAEAGFDLWTSGGPRSGSGEVMIWTDNQGRGTGGAKVLLRHTFAGQPFTLMQYGGRTGELIWSLHNSESRGTVHILAMLNWMSNHHYLRANASLGQADFGWEICSTGGHAQTFTMKSFTLSKG
jgi:hypothetical protein